MKTDPPIRLTRRECLRLGAGAVLSLGVWPGRLRAADNGRGGAFRFVVINDAHFQSPRCPAWFERVSASIRAHDGSPERGYFLCSANEGRIRRDHAWSVEPASVFRIPA